MRKNFNVINNIFLLWIIFIAIIFNMAIWFYTSDFSVNILFIVFSIMVVIIFYCYEKMFHGYMMEILIKLSDMMATIADMKEKEVFESIDDTIFSKLQSQTIKLTKILKARNKKIEDDKNEIKALISDIAHQLKTPLTNLKIYGELLQDPSLSEVDRKEFNKIMIISLNKLSFLVESMIKMSRLESEVIQLKPSLESLNETVLLAIKQVHKKAEEKKINIIFENTDKIDIVHDKNWTTEGLFNILDNAVKYSDFQGEIKVKLQSYEVFVRIDIEDRGIEIPEEETPKIFSRFYRGTNVRDEEGIGIGLYLTREIMSRQGGYIKVKSTKGSTTFSVFLPKNLRN